MKRLLLIDFMHVFFRSFHAYSGLSHDGQSTGALFGMVSISAKAINDLRPNRVIFCKDSKPYMRSDEYPGYKSDRSKVDKEVGESIQLQRVMCNKLLKHTGAYISAEPGMEADDLIAIHALMDREHDEVIALSNDSDLFQLFCDRRFKMSRGRGRRDLYGRDEFISEYGIDPNLWRDVTALSGGHNSLYNIKSIGEKTAIKILTDETFKNKKQDMLIKEESNILLNRRLARLPYYKFRDWSDVSTERHLYDERKLFRFLSNYGIVFNGSMRNAFEIMANAV